MIAVETGMICGFRSYIESKALRTCYMWVDKRIRGSKEEKTMVLSLSNREHGSFIKDWRRKGRKIKSYNLDMLRLRCLLDSHLSKQSDEYSICGMLIHNQPS